MRTLIKQLPIVIDPVDILSVENAHGLVLLQSSLPQHPYSRFSFATFDPFLSFVSYGSLCEIRSGSDKYRLYGNPWIILDELLEEFEIEDEPDVPFPLGGAFGYWGYELKHFVEPRIARPVHNDLCLPDCYVGFYDSLLAIDHHNKQMWIISTGLDHTGKRDLIRAQHKINSWTNIIENILCNSPVLSTQICEPTASLCTPVKITSNMSRQTFIQKVRRAKEYIYSGDIYQVNLSHRLRARTEVDPKKLYIKMITFSPAPFSAFIDCGEFQLVSVSPELFLKISGNHIKTRPIKGTRPRSSDITKDTRLAYELQTSQKENAELIMITDLLRNDLGRVCKYGSVYVSELLKLERHPSVHHLISTIEGALRDDISHIDALAKCFPGGSITGAPKIRAMEIIDELEQTARGPYTGAHGYIGFNRESQLSITIRTAICKDNYALYQTGAGIVADSDPEAEYAETIAKASGFLSAIGAFATSDFPQSVTNFENNVEVLFL